MLKKLKTMKLALLVGLSILAIFFVISRIGQAVADPREQLFENRQAAPPRPHVTNLQQAASQALEASRETGFVTPSDDIISEWKKDIHATPGHSIENSQSFRSYLFSRIDETWLTSESNIPEEMHPLIHEWIYAHIVGMATRDSDPIEELFDTGLVNSMVNANEPRIWSVDELVDKSRNGFRFQQARSYGEAIVKLADAPVEVYYLRGSQDKTAIPNQVLSKASTLNDLGDPEKDSLIFAICYFRAVGEDGETRGRSMRIAYSEDTERLHYNLLSLTIHIEPGQRKLLQKPRFAREQTERLAVSDSAAAIPAE